jgi:ESCRT-I complex subunit TSG101
MTPEECVRTKGYSNPAFIAELIRCLPNVYDTIYAESDEFVSSDGTCSELLVFKGTLPIFHLGSSYNIPVAIWINLDYPVSPPTVYVTPTPSMQIQPNHKHVDLEGRCYLHYLSEWDEHSHDLVGLCIELSSVFSALPPVFARTPVTSPACPVSSFVKSAAVRENACNESPGSGRRGSCRGRPLISPFPGSPSPALASPSLSNRVEYLSLNSAPVDPRKTLEDLQLGQDLLLGKIASRIHALSAWAEERKQSLASVANENMAMKIEDSRLRSQTDLLQSRLVTHAGLDEWLREHRNDGCEEAVADILETPFVSHLDELSVMEPVFEDLIYSANEALHAGVIDCDSWLKLVRDQCKRRYLNQALMRKMQSPRTPSIQTLCPTSQNLYPTPYSERQAANSL